MHLEARSINKDTILIKIYSGGENFRRSHWEECEKWDRNKVQRSLFSTYNSDQVIAGSSMPTLVLQSKKLRPKNALA
jgi:hypothetical protein